MSEVRIGNDAGSAIIQSFTATQITVTVQSNAVTGYISVTANTYTANSSPYQFIVAPRVTGFSPASAPVGTQVQVTGENFYVSQFGGYTEVKFGSGSAVPATVTSASQLVANVPSDAVTGPITVTTFFYANQLSGSSDTNFIVTGKGPVITGFSPSSGLPGTQVRIDGGDFTGASSVTFNGTNAPGFTVTAPTQIHVNVPTEATTGPIRVTTPLGTATSASNFVVTGAPAISDFTPAGGPVGTEVVINGLRFTGTTGVGFNGVNAGFTLTSDTQIHAFVPTDATSGLITVTNSFGVGTSVTSFVVGDAPAIHDFSPKGGPVGTPVTINGANFQNVTNVSFNGTNATDVTVTSTTQLSAKVPTDATSGPITVSTLTGTATTTNSFIVGAAPSITNFSPYFGNFGTTVTIGGENFLAGLTTVQFNGATSSNAVVTSATQISAPVPAEATTGPITVFTPVGTNTTSSNFFVTPRIDGFYPTNGAVGATITVGGMNFIGATSVKFGGADAVFTVNSTSNLFATLPAEAATGPVSVGTPAGIVTTSTNFHVSPTIASLTPGIGPVGASVAIAGSGFSSVSGVFFNGVSAAFAVDTTTLIHATVPPTASSGPVVVVTSEGIATSPTSFLVVPAITGFAPTNGGFGTPVTISGSSFQLVTAVRFNGVNASFATNSTTQMQATVPPGATTGPIQLVSPDGTVASTNDFFVTSTLTGFTPGSGPVGTEVTITGSGFTNVLDVQFNGADAVFLPVSESEIRATVPTNATTGFIRVNTAQGFAYSMTSFYVLPKIDGFTPTNGIQDTLVTLNGTGFLGTTNVQFNGTNAAFAVVSSTQIAANVPATATTGPITVSTPFGSMTTPTNFHVLAHITGANPGAASEQSPVTIYGSGFNGVITIQFNGTNVTAFLPLSPTNLITTVPVGARSGPITIITPENTAVSATHFIVLPTITTFTPTNGLPGTRVTIDGTSFYDVTAVRFNGTLATYTSNSTTRVTATLPDAATTGLITVTTPEGTASSASPFVVDSLRLSIQPAAGNQVVITWPGVATNYSLEATFSLTPTITWSAATNTPVLVNGEYTVTNNVSGTNQFFRLRK